MSTKYQPVIGLEIHAELKTASKMFCGCKNDPFKAKKPNIYTCPVCLGLPGALPVANKKAIEWVIKLGLALNCEINLFSKFDRKHYFYPDLPKGYQISQYDLPFCFDGYLDTSEGKVRIRRIHLEEDTAKLLHKTVAGKKISLIDFNRSGVPLVEIVTEPDIYSASQAKEFAKKLRKILRFLDIANCNMEQGGMRLEANVSVADSETLPAYKVELKNINSFRFLHQAISYEIERQSQVKKAGQMPIQETRGWNSRKNQTFSQRTKEAAADYRYFPDPDLPPIHFTEQQQENWRKGLPELPDQLAGRWQIDYNIEPRFADKLLTSRKKAQWLEKIWQLADKQDQDINQLANDLVNKRLVVNLKNKPQEVVVKFVQLHATEKIDQVELKRFVQETIKENPNVVEKYRSGKTQVIGFLIGQVMQQLDKKVDPRVVRKALTEQLG